MNKLEKNLAIYNHIVGIDLDGVTFNFLGSFSPYLQKNLKVTYHNNDIVDYYWYNCIPGISEGDFWKEYHNFGKNGGYKNLELMPGAKRAVSWILSNAKEAFFITGRPEYARKDTIEAVTKHFAVNEQSIKFSSGKCNKASEVNELGVSIFIEDAPHYALSVADNTKSNVYLMDATYNRNVNHPKIKRVYGWADLLTTEGLYG